MSNHCNKRHREDLATSSRAFKRVRYDIQMETTPDIVRPNVTLYAIIITIKIVRRMTMLRIYDPQARML